MAQTHDLMMPMLGSPSTTEQISMDSFHYDLRVALDDEVALELFVIVDDRTPDMNAVWYVETAEQCKRDSRGPSQGLDPPITYPYEIFTLWQVHIRTPDLPLAEVGWSAGAGSLLETVVEKYIPYDPHNPQTDLYHLNINWTDPKDAGGIWGFAYLTAKYSEVVWSTDPAHTRGIWPHPPVVARLTDEAARKAGLLPQRWTGKQEIGPPGEEVDLLGLYDWDSPVWPRGYPDHPVAALRVASMPRVRNGHRGSFPSATCPTRNWIRRNGRAVQLDRVRTHRASNDTGDIKQE